MSKKNYTTYSKVEAETEKVEPLVIKETKEVKVEEVEPNKIYLGPTIPEVVRHSTVFKEGILPDKLKLAVSDTPVLSRFIVDVKQAAELIKELNKRNSATANLYKVVAKKYL